MTAKDKTSKRGRPFGSKTEDRPIVVAQATRCPIERGGCDSTEREPYFNVRTQQIDGVDSDGREFDTVVWKRTKCRGCGMLRDDKFFELRGE